MNADAIATPAAAMPTATSAKPTRAERLGLAAMLILFLGLNLASYNYYPEVWCDEVWFSEPAVNLVKYGSFTSTVYQSQPPGSFPTVNCPLYTMALVPWLSATGTTVLAVRSFNYTLMAVAAFLVWLVSWRFG